MLKNLNKIKNELKDESNEHSNKLKTLRKQNVENEPFGILLLGFELATF